MDGRAGGGEGLPQVYPQAVHVGVRVGPTRLHRPDRASAARVCAGQRVLHENRYVRRLTAAGSWELREAAADPANVTGERPTGNPSSTGSRVKGVQDKSLSSDFRRDTPLDGWRLRAPGRGEFDPVSGVRVPFVGHRCRPVPHVHGPAPPWGGGASRTVSPLSTMAGSHGQLAPHSTGVNSPAQLGAQYSMLGLIVIRRKF